MTKKIVFGAALALVIVGIAAPSASANCAGSKSVSTYNPSTTAFSYWKTTLTPTPGSDTLLAMAWQPGGADVTGTCNVSPGILYFGVTSGDIGINYNLADACVTPAANCASGLLAVYASVYSSGVTGATQFLMTQAPETPAGAITYDYSTFGDHPMITLPRPTVTSSGPQGATVPLTLAVTATTAGLYEGTGPLVTGYNIRAFQGGADPGRLASAYPTLLTTLPASGGIAAAGATSVSCGSLADWYLVTQLVTTNGPAPDVSASTRVVCNPSLADPKYKVVPKKAGTKSIENN